MISGFQSILTVSVFGSAVFVAIIMIDSSVKHKNLRWALNFIVRVLFKGTVKLT